MKILKSIFFLLFFFLGGGLEGAYSLSSKYLMSIYKALGILKWNQFDSCLQIALV